MIIIDIFSVFDPLTASPFQIITNWNTILIIPVILPLILTISINNSKKIFLLVLKFLTKELSYSLKNRKFLYIFILSIFFFLSLNNTSSLLPHIFPITTHIAITTTLALRVCLSIELYKFIYYPKISFFHILPNSTPIILAPFIVLIEFISVYIRTVTLSVRLTANILAGHIIISIIISVITAPLGSLLLRTSQLPLIILEFAVANLQAYVFITLISMYIAEYSN